MELAVTKRTQTGKKLAGLRAQWFIPAIIYGKHVKEPIMVTVNKNEFIKLYNEEGTSTAITVKGDKVNELVLIQDIQLDSVSDYVLHVDFHAVKSDEKVTADIPVVLEGVSPVAKSGIWRVQIVNDTVEVEAFPQDLPKEFVVDISTLTKIHDTIHVKDLILDKKVEILSDPEDTIVTVVEFVEEVEEEETTETEEEATDKVDEKEGDNKQDEESKD